MTNLPEKLFTDAFQLLLEMKDTLLHLKTHSTDGKYKWHDDEIMKGNYLYYFYPSEEEKENVRNKINDLIIEK